MTMRSKTTPTEWVVSDAGGIRNAIITEMEHNKMNVNQIAKGAMLSHSTVAKLRGGITKSPQLRTCVNIMDVLGFELLGRRKRS
jgi:hypothetical protein